MFSIQLMTEVGHQKNLMPSGKFNKKVKLYSRRTNRPPLIIKIMKTSDNPTTYSRANEPTRNVSPLNWDPYDMEAEEMITPIVGRDRLNWYIDKKINVFLSASSCSPYFLDGANDFEKLSQLCPSELCIPTGPKLFCI